MLWLSVDMGPGGKVFAVVLALAAILPFALSLVPCARSVTVPTYSGQYNISSDEELATHAVSGSGTASDPYVIGGFSITGGQNMDGINVWDTDAYFVIRNYVYTGADGQGGVSIVNVSNGAVEGCTFTNGGISSFFVTNLLIEDNVFTGGGIELGFGWVGGSDIEGTSNVTIRGNTIQGSPYSGIDVDSTRALTILGNEISDSRHRAVAIQRSRDVLVSDNNLSGGESGVYSFDTQGLTVVANRIADFNVSGLEVMTDDYYNDYADVLVHHNNFFKCSFKDWTIQGRAGFSLSLEYPWGGNYWSNNSAPDLLSGPGQNLTGPDGISDAPFNVTNSVKDPYPLAEPFVRAGSPIAPVAAAAVMPPLGNPNSTFTLDADRTWDERHPATDLQYRWDFGGDGVWDIGWSAEPRQYHNYAGAGNETVILEARNSDGLTDLTTILLVVDHRPPVFSTDFHSGTALTKAHQWVWLNFTCDEQFSGLTYYDTDVYTPFHEYFWITVNGIGIYDPKCPVSMNSLVGGGTGYSQQVYLELMAKEDGRFVVEISATDRGGNEGKLRVVFEVHSNPLSPEGPYGPWPLALLTAGVIGSSALIALLLLRRSRRGRLGQTEPPSPGELKDGQPSQGQGPKTSD